MRHSMINFNRRTLGILAALLIGVLLAVYVFKVSWNAIGPLVLIGLMLLMHGGHGRHGSHDEGDQRDEHTGHTSAPAGDNNASTLAMDPNTRGLTTDGAAQPATREETHRHGCC